MKLLWQKTMEFGDLRRGPFRDDAGLDLVVARFTTLSPNTVTKVPCGIRVCLPPGVAALIVPRSSVAISGVMVLPTLIDPGFQGELFILAMAASGGPISLFLGQRIAQLLPIPALVPSINLMPVEAGDNSFPPSDRGESGWGSSGR